MRRSTLVRSAPVLALALLTLAAGPSAAKKDHKKATTTGTPPPACPAWSDAAGDSGPGGGLVPVGDKDLDLLGAEVLSNTERFAARISVARLGAKGPNATSGTGDEFTLRLKVDGVDGEITAKRDTSGSPGQAYARIGAKTAAATAHYDTTTSTITISSPAAELATALGKPIAEAAVVPVKALSATGSQGFGVIGYDEAPAPADTTLTGHCGPVADATAPLQLVRTGMDPGMTRALAATLYPLSPSYTEACPDSPNGRCRGTFVSGDRFYTLATGASGATVPLAEDKSECRIGSREPHVTKTGQITPCPYHFAWDRTPGGAPVADVSIDTTQFPSTTSAYAYFGLQENVGTALGHLSPGRPSTEHYAGLPAAETDTYRPEITTIERLDLDIRGRLCLGRHAADANYGRIAVYLLWYDPATGKGTELSIDLMAYKNLVDDVPLGEYFFEEEEWYAARGGPTPTDNRWVGHIDGPMWGIVPPELQLQRDTTRDCSSPLTAPPVHVEIPVGDVLRRLVAEGLMPQELLKGRYIGALVNGVESWGRAQLQSEVSGFTLWRRP
jgi:hypothetical protein